MRFSGYIKRDIDYINGQAAWTDDQSAIFGLLVAGRLTDSGIMLELSMSSARYYRAKKEITDKINRIMKEKQNAYGTLVPLYRDKIS